MLYPDINLQKKAQQNSTRYRTALYLRLSREDGDKTESDSIANQRTLLEAYAADQPTTLLPNIFGSHVKKAGPSAWMCTTSYFPNAL